MDEKLRQVIRRLLRGELPWPLYLHGPAGVGKTCASLCLLDYSPGLTLYATASGWSELQADIAQRRAVENYPGGSQTLTPAIISHRLETASLVVLDELAMRDRVSDWHLQCVKGVLDARHGKPLAVLGNHDLSSVSAIYDDRIADRLAEGTVIPLLGDSRRSRHSQRRCTVEPGRDES